MKEQAINKIIYFDKETISNILQEKNRGALSHQSDTSYTINNSGNISAKTNNKINLNVPFLARVGFMLSGSIDAGYIISRNSITTVSSTEISEFEKIKPSLSVFKNVQLYDIENSSTSFRVAGGYMRMLKAGFDEDVDPKEFMAVMNNYDGYDTYKTSENIYVRFNNTAFISNYKRNDLLMTTLTLYCIHVGRFDRDRFDFKKEISKMNQIISDTEKPQTLDEVYPPQYVPETTDLNYSERDMNSNNQVDLYDFLYACIMLEDKDE